jgi:hypothetical protein
MCGVAEKRAKSLSISFQEKKETTLDIYAVMYLSRSFIVSPSGIVVLADIS